MSALSREHVKKGFFWATSGAIAQGSFQLISLALLARLLDPYEFGIVSVAIIVSQLSLVFSEFGIGPYLVQSPRIQESLLGTAFRLSLVSGCCVSAIVWTLAPLLADALAVPELTLVVRAYTVILLIKAWSAPSEALLQRDLSFRFLARADATSFGVGYALVAVSLAWAGFSYWALVIGHIVQTSLKAAMTISRHPTLSENSAAADKVQPIVYFGAGQTLSRLASYLASQIDSVLVASKLGVAAIGIYGRANQLVTMPAFQLGQVFDKVIFPSVARLQGDRNRVAASYRVGLTAITAVSIPVALSICLLGDSLVIVLLGEAWQPVSDPLKILAIAVPFRLIHKVSDPTARALGATYSRAWRQWLLVGVAFIAILGLLRYGIVGVAGAIVFASIVDAVLMVALCCWLSALRVVTALRSFFPGVRLGLFAFLIMLGFTRVSIYLGEGHAIQLVAALLALFAAGGITIWAPQRLLGSEGSQVLLILQGKARLDDLIQEVDQERSSGSIRTKGSTY